MNDKTQTALAKTRRDVFVVEKWTNNDGAEQSNWTRVGVAFAHKDGKGFNLELKALPIDGKLVIRQHEPKDEG
jgi:hypothetical protein